MFPAVKRVFLSSVGRTLKEYRDAVYQAIGYLDGFMCVRMEEFGARDRSSEEFCREAVQNCDIFVGVLGPEYGSCLRGSKKSFSELEYDAATEACKPRLMFYTADDFPRSSPPEARWKQKKQAAFRKRATEERQCFYFESPLELAIKVLAALYNYSQGQTTELQEQTPHPRDILMKNAKKTRQPKRAKRVESTPEKPVARPPLTTLFFPFVTNQGNHDTGIVITNPTAEPFCETPQYGSCSIHFFGNVDGGPAPRTQVTAVVPPGGQITFTLAAGGNLGAPSALGFQGYLIVECWFKNARGFAMISDVAGKHPTGYLAEVIPSREVIPDREV